MDRITGTKQYGENPIHWITSPNKNMTLTSLMAIFELFEAPTKDEFCKWYYLAFHDKSGGTTWNMMQFSKKSYAPRKS